MNRFIKIIFLLTILGIPITLYGQKQLIRVYLQNSAQARLLMQQHVDFAQPWIDRYADIVADNDDVARLESLGFPVEVLDRDLDRSLARQLQAKEDMGAFHTVAEMVDELFSVAAAHPDITLVKSIGKSIEQRDIWAIKVSDNPGTDEADEPEVLYIANIHAREIITPEIVLYFLNHLVDNYGVDLDITDMIDHRQLWIVPTANPDGHVHVEEVDRWWRKNRRENGDGTFGVDLNRNFGYNWAYDNIGSSPNPADETYRGTSAFSEPETQALRDFVAQHHFVAALSYHSYGDLWLFPWDYQFADTPHHLVFVEMAKGMTEENHYVYGNPNMGTIYITNGSSDDYFYTSDKEHPIFAFTPEVGTLEQGHFFPPESLIPQLVGENLGANLYLARIADILQDDPWRMLPPKAPAMLASSTSDDNGVFLVHWQSEPDSANAPVGYDVEEIVRYTIGEDGAETDNNPWFLDGFEIASGKSFQGANSYYSGSRDRYKATMTAAVNFTPNDGDSLTFRTWYDLERHYDYAYVEVSEDNGGTFQTLAGNITTEQNPNDKNEGNGITGASSGWVQATFSLDQYAGKNILLRFRYVTDAYNHGEGIYFDDIRPVPTADGFIEIASRLSQTSLELQKTYPGFYYYRARAADAEDQESAWSYIATSEIDFGEKGDVIRDSLMTNDDVIRCAELILGVGNDPTVGEQYRADLDTPSINGQYSLDIVDLVKLVQIVRQRNRFQH
jgi:hypothetical protein